MAHVCKYTALEIEERLSRIDDIPAMISTLLTGHDFVTHSELSCILTNYAPADYSTIPIDGVTVYWDNGLIKARGSGGDSLWELRENDSGEKFLFSNLPVVTKYGITTYSEADVSDIFLDIFLDIPIDNDTIYWHINDDGTRVLKSKGGGGTGSCDELSKFFKGHYDSNGNLLYIEALKDIAVNGGVTLYYEDSTGELPSIYEDIPIDGTTIVWTKDSLGNDVLSAKGFDKDELQEYLNDNLYITESDLSLYAKINWVNANFLPLTGGTISGSLTILDTLTIDDIAISKTSSDVLFIDANLVVRGGITTYSNGEITVPSIWDDAPLATDSNTKGIASFDPDYFYVNNGYVTFIGGSGGGGIDGDLAILAWQGFSEGTYNGEVSKTIIIPDSVSQLNNDLKFVTSEWVADNYLPLTGGTITGNLIVEGTFTIGDIIIRKTGDGILYIDSNVIVKGGITAYGTEDESFPSIWDDAPIASTTQLGVSRFDSNYFSVNNGLVSFIGEVGGLDEEELGNYLVREGYVKKATSLAGYGITDAYTITEIDSLLLNYVTIAGSEDVTGVHNFVNGLAIGGISMSKYSNGVLYIEGDVVVSGGVTMYGTSGSASTIMDGVLVDGTTISKANGYLEVIGGTGGSIDYPLTWTGYASGSWDGSASATIAIPSKVSELTNDSKFLTTVAFSDVTGSVANSQLANSSVTIAGTNVALGGSITADTLISGMGLASKYAPLSYAWVSHRSGDTILDYEDLDTYKIRFSGSRAVRHTNSSGATTHADALYTFRVGSSSFYGMEIYQIYDNTAPSTISELKVRYIRDTSAFTGWKTIAFTDSDITGNAATATQLKNERTIWGRPFDGTANVSGALTGVTNITASGTISSSDVTLSDTLSVNGISIYKSSNGYLYIDGDVVINGGVTMYGTDGVEVPDVMSFLTLDPNTLEINASGQLTVVGGTGGGASSWDELEGIPSYLGTSGLANSLSITVGSNSAVSYNGSTSRSISINYSTLGLDSRYVGVDDTLLTLNGSSKDAGSASFYAPTSYGTSGYVLKSNGSNSAPTWITQESITAGQAAKVYLNVSGNPGPFPVVFADNSACGTAGYYSVYVDSVSGAGYDPYTNYFYASGYSVSDSYYGMYTYSNGLELKTYSLFKLTQNGTTKMSMSSAGNFLFYGSVSPNSNAGQDLGTSSYWWDNIYGTSLLLRRTSTTQGGKIYFDSTTMHITNSSGSGSIYFDTNKSSSVSAAMWLTYDEKLWFRKGIGGRQICLNGNGGGLYCYLGTSAAWSMGMPYLNSSGTVYGMIGAYGASNRFDYYFFGTAYNNYIFKVDTSGNVLATGGITMYSDVTKKNILNDEFISIDKIANAPSFLYTFKDDEKKHIHLGSSAQYWQSINKDYVMDNDGTLSMGYGNIALTCAISISKEVLELKERIKELENEIKNLKSA